MREPFSGLFPSPSRPLLVGGFLRSRITICICRLSRTNLVIAGPKYFRIADHPGAIACGPTNWPIKGDTVQAGEVYPNGEPLHELIRHHAAHYGSLIRCRYGEPFYTTETMRVEDVTSLEVSTF